MSFIAAIDDIVNEADSLFSFFRVPRFAEVVNLYHGRGPCRASEFRVRCRLIFHQIADKDHSLQIHIPGGYQYLL